MLHPSEVQSAFEKEEDENYSFRIFLKGNAKAEELDEHFHHLHKELFQTYDCSQCRNCCTLTYAQFEPDEIRPAAEFLEMSKKDFIEQFLTIDGSDYYAVQTPCSFLCKDGSCRLEDKRPDGCAGFPFTDRPNRLFSLRSFFVAATICPVAYELLQRLKDIYRFKRRK